jgi:hypothetical protein
MIPENETPKERRNRLQRARRAEPNRKEAEARATRRSYYKRAQAYDPSHLAWPQPCSTCARLQEQHDL